MFFKKDEEKCRKFKESCEHIKKHTQIIKKLTSIKCDEKTLEIVKKKQLDVASESFSQNGRHSGKWGVNVIVN